MLGLGGKPIDDRIRLCIWLSILYIIFYLVLDPTKVLKLRISILQI